MTEVRRLHDAETRITGGVFPGAIARRGLADRVQTKTGGVFPDSQ